MRYFKKFGLGPTIKLAGFLSLALLFSVCQKKVFHKVTIKGRLISLSANQPMQTVVYVMMDDAHSSKSSQLHSQSLWEGQSGSDGSFYVQSKASKAGTRYYLYIKCDSISTGKVNLDVKSGELYANGVASFNAGDDQTTDLGTIYAW